MTDDPRVTAELIEILQDQVATLTADLDTARHTIRLLMRFCQSLITNPNQDPALLTFLNEILDPNERGSRP